MNILIDIGHPAHVHYYRNLARELENSGHRVICTVKDIPIALGLLDSYRIPYQVFPKKADALSAKARRQVFYDYLMWKTFRRECIDLAVGTSVSIVHASMVSRAKSIVFDDDDDEVQPLVTKYVNPFADTLLSPDALKGKRKRTDTVYYPGYHELAYLHPKRFVPDPAVLEDAGLEPGDKYFIMRFNVFKAHHDKGINGLSISQKLKLIELLKSHGRILITTERDMEPEFMKYRLKVCPEKIHSLMAFATLFIGDSQTMTSEAAVLGIPSLRCNSFAGKISYLEEQENKYGLTYAFPPAKFGDLISKLRDLLSMGDLKSEWQRRREAMLADKIDVTSFWLWFILNYPASKKNSGYSPDFYKQFKS